MKLGKLYTLCLEQKKLLKERPGAPPKKTLYNFKPV